MPRATVVIATKNRLHDLGRAVDSALLQTGDIEVLVVDDGSTDATSEHLRANYPQVRLHRFDSSRGYIVRRNQAAALAASTVVFSLDDDAVFSTPHVVEQTLAEFDEDRVGAVAIPYIDVRKGTTVRQRAPDAGAVYLRAAFVGTAHALRRDLFLALGGYRASLFHQGEEGDLCLRMLQAGYVVRAGLADPIHHFESPLRDMTRLFHFNARNTVLYAWQNVPVRYLPLRVAGMNMNLLRDGIMRGRLGAVLAGLAHGYADIVMRRVRRQPVGDTVYRLQRYIQRAEPVPIHAVRDRLPPVTPVERIIGIPMED